MTTSVLRPTIRGVAVVCAFGVVVVAGFVTDTPELAPLAVVIGVPLAVSPVLAYLRTRRTLRATEFHAHVEPGTVAVGSSMQIKLSVTNRSSGGSVLPPLGLAPFDRQWRARSANHNDAPQRRLIAPSISTMDMLPRPGPGSTESCLLDIPTRRRGAFELPSQRSWTYDSFGLFGASGPRTPTVFAVIYPVALRPDRLVSGIPATQTGAQPAALSLLGSGLGELEGIRPYEAGDRLGLLHWPAKARYGTWFVRQFGVEGSAARSVVLDDRAGVHRRAEFEQLISAAMWVVAELLAERKAVHLLTLAGRSYTFEPNDSGSTNAKLALAELQPNPTRSLAGLIAMPADAMVLTTRTGAERLTPHPLGRPAPAVPVEYAFSTANASTSSSYETSVGQRSGHARCVAGGRLRAGSVGDRCDHRFLGDGRPRHRCRRIPAPSSNAGHCARRDHCGGECLLVWTPRHVPLGSVHPFPWCRPFASHSGRLDRSWWPSTSHLSTPQGSSHSVHYLEDWWRWPDGPWEPGLRPYRWSPPPSSWCGRRSSSRPPASHLLVLPWGSVGFSCSPKFGRQDRRTSAVVAGISLGLAAVTLGWSAVAGSNVASPGGKEAAGVAPSALSLATDLTGVEIRDRECRAFPSEHPRGDLLAGGDTHLLC